jgi:chromosome segregation ATPase
MPPAVAEPLPQDLPATTAAHRAALQDRVQELRQRRTDLSKKLETIEQRLAEKGNAAGPTQLEEAKAALQETLQKEELEEKYLQETIDHPPTSATAP